MEVLMWPEGDDVKGDAEAVAHRPGILASGTRDASTRIPKTSFSA
jgi:hypothetical protein